MLYTLNILLSLVKHLLDRDTIDNAKPITTNQGIHQLMYNMNSDFLLSRQSFSPSLKSHSPRHPDLASLHMSHSHTVIYEPVFASRRAGLTWQEEEIHHVAVPLLRCRP
jgi:hypothetical protein